MSPASGELPCKICGKASPASSVFDPCQYTGQLPPRAAHRPKDCSFSSARLLVPLTPIQHAQAALRGDSRLSQGICVKRAKRKSTSHSQADEKTFCPGVTGTNGKTNTGFLIDSILRESGNVTEPTDAGMRDILVRAMTDFGADPALVYAFQKTGVYVCDENKKRLPKEKLKAFDGAVGEYLAALKRLAQ